MRKFILLALATAILSAIISEISFISWWYSLAFYLIFIALNFIFFLAYQYDDLFIKALKKTLDYLLIKDEESFNLAIIFMWVSFNLFVILWRWQYVR